MRSKGGEGEAGGAGAGTEEEREAGAGAGRVSKSCRLEDSVWGTFWTSGEHFGPKSTHFCLICSFFANHAPFNRAFQGKSWNLITRTNKLNPTVVQKHEKKVPRLSWF